MKPWFEKEAEIIPFPKKPERQVIKMPSVSEYPDFITGVLDLQARRDKGQIGKDSYNRLYQDLIHRFMKKESFETPWFLREAPADAGIMGTQAATDFKSLAKQVSSLPADTDPRLIDKIVSAIEMARSPKSKKGSRQDAYTRIKDPLKKVGEVDSDMKKSYRFVAKQMLGNNLTSDEIFKQIIPAIQQDKCIILKELTALRSDLSKIIPTYGLSKQTAFFYTDLLMTQPGQGVGPGEILFSVFSQSIKKGGKGDLTLKSGKGIEVKGADEAGSYNIVIFTLATTKRPPVGGGRPSKRSGAQEPSHQPSWRRILQDLLPIDSAKSGQGQWKSCGPDSGPSKSAKQQGC